VHKLYRDLVESRAAGMLAAARSVSAVTHSGFKGTLREVVVRDLLGPFCRPPFSRGLARS
jgi:hypothetical protein